MSFERNFVPQEYQDRLNEVGGLNCYGEPNFLIAWSQSHTFRAGARWPSDHYVGYREVFTATGSPSRKISGYWMILEWIPPHVSKYTWEYLNRDEETGLQNLGPWNPSGTYRVALKLQTQEVKSGVLTLTPIQLDSYVLDNMMPLILQAKAMNKEKRMELAKQDRARAEEKQDRKIEAMVRDAKVAFKGPVSYRGQKRTASSVQQREILIEQQWNQWLKNHATIRRGFSQNSFV